MRKRGTRIQLTVDPEDAAVIDEAIQQAGTGGFSSEADRRRWILKWMLRATARAILRAGSMPVPLAADVRPESAAENAERVGDLFAPRPHNVIALAFRESNGGPAA